MTCQGQAVTGVLRWGNRCWVGLYHAWAQVTPGMPCLRGGAGLEGGKGLQYTVLYSLEKQAVGPWGEGGRLRD